MNCNFYGFAVHVTKLIVQWPCAINRNMQYRSDNLNLVQFILLYTASRLQYYSTSKVLNLNLVHSCVCTHLLPSYTGGFARKGQLGLDKS